MTPSVTVADQCTGMLWVVVPASRQARCYRAGRAAAARLREAQTGRRG